MKKPLTTIKIPMENKFGKRVEDREVSGTVMLFRVGGRKLRALVHDNQLTHIASGRKLVGGLNAIKIERMATLGHNTRTSDRMAAFIAVDRLVAACSVDAFWKKVDEAPVINP